MPLDRLVQEQGGSAMTEFTVVMNAEVVVRLGDTLTFTPSANTATTEDREWGLFCERRWGEECKLVDVQLPPERAVGETAAERLVSAMDVHAGPAFTVRFKDGVEKRLGLHNLTRPLEPTV